MKNDMAKSFKVGDKSYSLSSFGIATLGYFNSPENETGVYHIDGDKDDSKTSANTDKLREMISNDPDTVISFFHSYLHNCILILERRWQHHQQAVLILYIMISR